MTTSVPEMHEYRNVRYRFGYSIDQDAFVGHIHFKDGKKTFTFYKENAADCETDIRALVDEELSKDQENMQSSAS